MQATIKAFFDNATNTVSYLVSDPATNKAAIIDPVLDYDHRSGKVSTRSAKQILEAAKQAKLDVIWILETHAHADHLSARSEERRVGKERRRPRRASPYHQGRRAR